MHGADLGGRLDMKKDNFMQKNRLQVLEGYY